MLSPYNNTPTAYAKKRSQSRGPNANRNSSSSTSSASTSGSSASIGNGLEKGGNDASIKELTEYLNADGDILYPDLIRDEIAAVDKQLLKEAKKAGQVGGIVIHYSFSFALIFWLGMNSAGGIIHWFLLY